MIVAHGAHQVRLAEENRAVREGLVAAGAHGRDAKHLDVEVEAARVTQAERGALERSLAQAQLASENKVLRLRVGAQVGRDCKALDQEVERAREEAGELRISPPRRAEVRVQRAAESAPLVCVSASVSRP